MKWHPDLTGREWKGRQRGVKARVVKGLRGYFFRLVRLATNERHNSLWPGGTYHSTPESAQQAAEAAIRAGLPRALATGEVRHA